MRPRELCEEIRSTWMDAFDQGETPLEWVAAHVEGCEACRKFAAGAERARHELRSVALPVVDAAADAAVLAAVRQERARRRSWWERIPAPPALRPVLPLAAAGAGAFAATLAIALALGGGLSPSVPGAGSPGSLAAARGGAPHVAHEDPVDLDLWVLRGYRFPPPRNMRMMRGPVRPHPTPRRPSGNRPRQGRVAAPRFSA